jgi:hypothetical protein
MATHFWPGQTVNALPFDETWDSGLWDTLPALESPYGLIVGFDTNRPGEATSEFPDANTSVYMGSDGAVFHVVGQGRDVEFWVEHVPPRIGDTYNGMAMTLYDFTMPDESAYVYKHAGADFAPNPRSVGIRAFLVEGKDYYLNAHATSSRGAGAEGGASGSHGDPGYVSGAGQSYHLNVRVAPTVINDRRDDATNVIIPSDGAQYISPEVLNADYTLVDSPTDDPGSGGGMVASAWWRYVPQSDTPFAVTAYFKPAGYDGFLAAYRMGDLGALSLIGLQTYGNPCTVGDSADAGETIYFQLAMGDSLGEPFMDDLGQRYRIEVTGGKTVLQVPVDNPDPDPNPPPLDDQPWASDTDPEPDHFTPGAMMPADNPAAKPGGSVGDTGSATLLELVRAFSSAVRRAVRITGPTTIEMVDPAEPLPVSFTSGDAGAMYTTTARSASAEEKTLSVRAGDVKVEATANVKSGDVRVVRSTWRIPDRLPVYGLPSAKVKRIAYTFSPDGFESSVEFHFAAVPIEARRI